MFVKKISPRRRETLAVSLAVVLSATVSTAAVARDAGFSLGTPAVTAEPATLAIRSKAAPVPSPLAEKRVKPVDETALRYYASIDDTARVSAEIARLRQRFPNWVPPDDLEFGTAAVDEHELWDLFAQQRYDEVVERIAEMGRAHDGYRPSKDLSTKLEAAIAHRDVAAAADRSDWNAVLQIAAAHPGILVCADVDTLWRVGRATAEIGEVDQSVAAYRYILTNCTDPGERLATVQKASEHLSMDEVDRLIALGRRKPDGTGEFDGVRLDLLRRRVGDVAAGKSKDLPDERDLRRLEAAARTRPGRDDAMLLGWYAYASKTPDVALRWFETADAARSDPKSIEGRVLALRDLKRTGDALALARANLSKSPELRKIFTELASARITGPDAEEVEPAILTELGDLATADRDPLAAQSLGWDGMKRGRVPEARAWFRKSMEFGATAEAAVGLAVSSDRLGDKDAARKVYRDFAARFPEVAALTWLGAEPAGPTGRRHRAARGAGTGGGWSGDERAALALHQAGRYGEAAAAFEQIDRRRGAKYDRDVVLAWAYYNSGDYRKARDLFSRLDKIKSTRDTRYGGFIAESKDLGRRDIW